MKKFIKIIVALAFAAALVGCNNKAEYVSKSFVRFSTSGGSVKENAGTIKIPVYAYTSNGKTAFPRTDNAVTTVNFKVIESTAKSGENFNVTPASGQLSFNGNSEAFIEIQIVDKPGAYTGDLKFGIEITGASDGYTIGGTNQLVITIQDLDHPYANYHGTWVSETYVDAWNMSWNIKTEIKPVSDGKLTDVTITNLCPYSASAGYPHTLVGQISEDGKSIVIPSLQWVVQGGIYFLADPMGDYTKPLVFNVDLANKKISTSQTWGAYIGGAMNDLDSYFDFIEGPITFTKQ